MFRSYDLAVPCFATENTSYVISPLELTPMCKDLFEVRNQLSLRCTCLWACTVVLLCTAKNIKISVQMLAHLQSNGVHGLLGSAR